MKNQYVGDISDYRKYALLRILAGPGDIRIGICWMLTPDDGRQDGRRIAYLCDPLRWRAFDPELFDLLRSVMDEPVERRLSLIEVSGIIPGAEYFNQILPDDIEGRRVFFQAGTTALAECDLIFFDPDNGLDVPSRGVGRQSSSKYVDRQEVLAVFNRGKSTLIYQHFPREQRNRFIKRIGHSLRDLMPDASIWAVCSTHAAFLLAINPRQAVALTKRVTNMATGPDRLFSKAGPVA